MASPDGGRTTLKEQRDFSDFSQGFFLLLLLKGGNTESRWLLSETVASTRP
jgi:hypothetical protein